MSRKPIAVIRRVVQEANEGINCSPESYWRAAVHRLEVGKFLNENSSYRLEALYLAGYAVECSLKSLILERVPRKKRPAVCEEISSGAKAHKFDFLVYILNLKQCSLPVQPARSLEVIKCEWTTNLRYIGTCIPRQELDDFIKHVEVICEWVKRSK